MTYKNETTGQPVRAPFRLPQPARAANLEATMNDWRRQLEQLVNGLIAPQAPVGGFTPNRVVGQLVIPESFNYHTLGTFTVEVGAEVSAEPGSTWFVDP